MERRFSSRRAAELLLCELAAVPLSVGYTLAIWYTLGQVSSSHTNAHTIGVQNFLQVPIVQGALIEALGVFVMLSPIKLVNSELEQTVLGSTVLTIMSIATDNLTGGFYNAMPVLSLALMYKKMDMWFELLVVYFGGSILGAVVAWKTYLESTKHKRW